MSCSGRLFRPLQQHFETPLNFLEAEDHSPKRPLPDLAGTLDEPAHQVRRHEQTSVLSVVLVPANPEGPSLSVEDLPELLHALLVRVVGVNLPTEQQGLQRWDPTQTMDTSQKVHGDLQATVKP